MTARYERDPNTVLIAFIGGAVTPYSWLGPIVGAVVGVVIGFCDTRWRLR